MKFKCLNLALVFGLVSVLSPAAFARSADVCSSAEPAVEGSCLLTKLKDQALQVRQLSDNLQDINQQMFENYWQYDSSILQRAKIDVNKMDYTLYRLRTIQPECRPSERRAISLLAPSVVELTNGTQAAINYLDQHEQALMYPSYRDNALVMYNKASRVVNFVNEYQDYVLERARLRQLRSGLGSTS